MKYNNMKSSAVELARVPIRSVIAVDQLTITATIRVSLPCKYSAILYDFQVIWRWRISWLEI